MATLTVFKSRASTMGYAFRTGKVVHFAGGIYATSSPKEIEELTEVCTDGNPNFYIDPDEKVIDSEKVDPMAALRATIREEERAKLLNDMNQRDMGSTEQTKLQGIANSKTIHGLQVQSEAQGAAAHTGPIVVAKTGK